MDLDPELQQRLQESANARIQATIAAAAQRREQLAATRATFGARRTAGVDRRNAARAARIRLAERHQNPDTTRNDRSNTSPRAGEPTTHPTQHDHQEQHVTTPQLGQADLTGLTAEEIVKAREAGQLAEYLAGPPALDRSPILAEPQLGAEDLARMTPAQIEAACRAGQLATYLGTTTHH